MENKNKLNTRESGNCVVHDDTHGWGGDEDYISYNNPKDIIKDADELINKLVKKFPEIHIDEPMNWPYR